MNITKTPYLEYDSDFFEKNRLIVDDFFFAAHVPDSFFFIKDKDTRMVLANNNILKSFGHYDKKPFMGLKNEEYMHGRLCEHYTRDDMSVIKGRSIVGRTELTLNLDGKTLVWRSTTKYPLYNADKEIIGLVSLSLLIDNKGVASDVLDLVESYIEKNLSDNLDIVTLSKIANLSISAFERKFKSVYKMSPVTYINYMRVNRAAFLLANTSKTVAEISNEVGFYDQSYMCKTFRKVLNFSPKEYRNFLAQKPKI